MSVYNNDKRIYPPLDDIASAPPDDESQIYRLKKIEEIENFFNEEIKQREKLYKKFKRYSTTVVILDHSLITATVITGSGSIAALATGIGLPLSIALGGVSLCLSIATAITHRTNKIIDAKSKKHDKICVLAQTKLDSIHDTVSKAITDGHVDSIEFQRIIQEKQRYLLLKQEIRHKTKRVTDNINEEQRQAILDQGRLQGRNDFLKQIANTSNTQPVNVT